MQREHPNRSEGLTKPLLPLCRRPCWNIIVPVDAEARFLLSQQQSGRLLRHHAASTTSSLSSTDVLLRVLEYVSLDDFATLKAIPLVCRQWWFYSNYMPHWEALLRQEAFFDAYANRKIGSLALFLEERPRTTELRVRNGRKRDEKLLREVWRLQQQRRREHQELLVVHCGDDEPSTVGLTRRLALAITQASIPYGEYRYRLDNDPGLLCGMFHSRPECIEVTFCCLCHYFRAYLPPDDNQPPSLPMFIASGFGALVALGFGCVFHCLLMFTLVASTGSRVHLDDCESILACCGALLCPPCFICQRRRVRGAYSVLCDEERQQPLAELIVEIEEMV